MGSERARLETPPDGQTRERAFAPTRLNSTRPPVGTWLAIVLAAVAIAVLKPWATEPPASPSTGAVAEGQIVGTTSDPSGLPSPTLRPDSAGPLVALFCLDPQSWRIATIERWRDQSIRVWRAIDPIDSASGPDDPRIPIFPVVSEGVTELGWCAPVVGPDRPDGLAAMEAWHRTPDGPVAMPTTGTRATGAGTSFGGLYLPPGDEGARLWADGVYVFRHHEATGRERWFAVEVELRASTGTPEPDADGG